MPKLVPPVVARGRLAERAQPVLTGDGLTLRPWTPADVPAVVDAYADPLIQRWHLRSMTSAEAEAWVADAARTWADETMASWAVTAETGVVVARMTLGAVNLEAGGADVRYWVVPAARGRRVASRALGIVTAWAVGDLGLHRLLLEHSTQNVASCRVAERAGFALDGTARRVLRHDDGWHDLHLHSYVAPDPSAP